MVDELMKRADNRLNKLLDHNLQFEAQTGAAQIVDELMADRKTMQRGLTAWEKQCDTLTHQVLCCGVAASHPDATLTTRGAYAGKWNSAQAEEVRKLRAECDQMREERTAWRVTAENAEAEVKQARIDALEEAKQAVSAEEILEPEDNADDDYNCGVLDCVRAVEKLKGKHHDRHPATTASPPAA
jgi:hypothetical protein